MKKLTAISIYSGCGGIDIGFEQAGFKVLYSMDNWDIACQSLKKNNLKKRVECANIRSIDFKKLKKELAVKELDCLIGGPPCPPYSKSRFYLKDKKRALEDENSFTLQEYFRALKELSPKSFFFENVPGFVFKPHMSAFNYLKKKSDELGYEISFKVLNSANYGVPQIRERFICVGVKKGLPKFIFPEIKYSEKGDNGKNKWVTAGDVLKNIDFPLPEDKDMLAGSKHSKILEQIPPGENYLFFTKERGHPKPLFKWRSRYWSFLLKLSPNKPSWTIQASHSNNMGPFHWNNRFLRIQEIKRLQSFPDNYKLIGSFKDQWRQIGNAVPPLLAKSIADELKGIL